MLQFGHGGDAVGDFEALWNDIDVDPLQFGHGGDAVGDPKGREIMTVKASKLQFGHGGDAVGDTRGQSSIAGCRLASIRPRR